MVNYFKTNYVAYIFTQCQNYFTLFEKTSNDAFSFQSLREFLTFYPGREVGEEIVVEDLGEFKQ